MFLLLICTVVLHVFGAAGFQAYDDPLAFLHMAVEGQVSFRALLYVPGSLPWELSRNMFGEIVQTQTLQAAEPGDREI